MNIKQKLSKIQQEFKANKSRYNSFGKYNFRSAEDILEALKPYEKEYEVTFVVKEKLINSDPFPVIESTAMCIDCTDDGGSMHATAIVGVDLDQKGMQMPQKFGSASSYGKKYALGNLLLIDDTADPDATNDHGKGKTKAKPELKGAALTKAKAALKAGTFTIEDIQKKYTIPAAVLKTLK